MITSVRLQNFKSFRDARINLGLRNCLVGPNMSGKSNLIEVFRFLQRVSFPEAGTWGLASAFPGGFFEWTWKGGDSKLIGITLEGTASDDGSEWCYEISIAGDERGSIRVQEERLTLDHHVLIQVRDGVRPLVNKDGREVGATDPGRAVVEFEIPGWDGSFLRKSIASWRFYRLSPQLMRQANPAAAPPFLTETGDNLSAWLMQLQTRHSASFANIRDVCRDVLPDLVDLFTWPTPQATVSVASNERHLSRPVSIWEMSDGELAFLALLSLIFCPAGLKATLYCIEEPENYLHPKMIETLIGLLKQAQGEHGTSGSGQVIATTHSPHLVDKLSLDELIVMEKHGGATIVTYPKDKTHLRDLLRREELGLGDLFYSGALQSG